MITMRVRGEQEQQLEHLQRITGSYGYKVHQISQGQPLRGRSRGKNILYAVLYRSPANVLVVIGVLVVALVMVPLEVTDELLERVSLILPNHAFLDAQRCQRRLVHLALLDDVYNEVEHDARVAEIERLQSQRRQFWEDRHVHRCRRMVVIVVGRLHLAASAIVIGPFWLCERLQETDRPTPVDLDCGNFCAVLKD